MSHLSGVSRLPSPSQPPLSQIHSVVLSPLYTLITRSTLHILSKIGQSKRGATRYQDVLEKSSLHDKNMKALLGQECSSTVVHVI